jgi:hypothetical protein
MNHPVNYTHDEWASWYQRTRLHVRLAPGLTRELRSDRGTISTALFSTAAASLVELDEDIVAGEFLARMMRSPSAHDAVTAILREMSGIAQELLQAIVEARTNLDPCS